jgi:hypothetical protein
VLSASGGLWMQGASYIVERGVRGISRLTSSALHRSDSDHIHPSVARFNYIPIPGPAHRDP